MTAYVFAGLLTLTTYALAGTMREQVCTYMCPWPRIQGALVDKETLTVTYRSERGDPRGAHKKGDTWEGRGDCIDCRQCVVVCPMGIDIRKGAQLECIQCGLCIDACDAVMKKINRPTGLIAYDTDENVLLRWMKQEPAAFRPLRARTILYGAVFLITAAVMGAGLLSRSDMEFSALKDRTLPYVQLASGEIRNAYTIKVINKQRKMRDMMLSVEGLAGARVEVIGEGEEATSVRLTVQPDGVDRYRLLVTAPADQVSGGDITLVLADPASGKRVAVSTPFAGPER